MDDVNGVPTAEGAPPQEPPVEGVPQQTRPTGGQQAVPPPQSLDPWEMPPPVKVPTDWAFFALGFFTPFAIGVLAGLASSAFNIGVFLAQATSFLILGLFLVFLFLWVSGRSKGNVRMSSYGKGGMWAYIVIPLGLLLLFGSCLINPELLQGG